MPTEWLPRAAARAVGVSGVVAGVKMFEAAETGPVPTPFVALTVHVYGWPFVRPFTTIGFANVPP